MNFAAETRMLFSYKPVHYVPCIKSKISLLFLINNILVKMIVVLLFTLIKHICLSVKDKPFASVYLFTVV